METKNRASQEAIKEAIKGRVKAMNDGTNG
jgi:hypothetical protein